jgi:hypothetical protein
MVVTDQIHILKSYLLVHQNVTVFGDTAYNKEETEVKISHMRRLSCNVSDTLIGRE